MSAGGRSNPVPSAGRGVRGTDVDRSGRDCVPVAEGLRAVDTGSSGVPRFRLLIGERTMRCDEK